MKKTLLSITLCFLYTANGLANNKIDSLKHALKTAKADTTKIVTLNRLSDALWRTGEYDQALDYASQSLNKIVIALRARGSQGDGAKQPFETQPDGAKRSPQMLGWLKKAKINLLKL
ncbi:MAG: hypothetical protein FVQ77_09640 [Cytophagales bacterium]|nr:hypothetical protein [Cytophagales bacterium]